MSDVHDLTLSFAGGEITPELTARVDTTKFQTGLRLCRNMVTLPYGPAQSRPGTYFVNQGGKADSAIRLIPFVFNTDQAFALEFGDQYVRFHTQGGTLLEAAKTITAITQANPAVVTCASHGYVTGDWVYVAGVIGMAQVNGRFLRVGATTTNTFQLQDVEGNALNTTGYGAYVSGGTVARVYQVATPYLAADLFSLRYSQSNDVLTITHPSYQQRELRRLGATSWQLALANFTLASATYLSPQVRSPVASGNVANTYVVTGVTEDNQESAPTFPAFEVFGWTLAGVTLANPAVFTTTIVHSLFVGRWVAVSSNVFPGVTIYAIVETTPSATTFTLRDAYTNAIVSAVGAPAFVSGTVSALYAQNDLSIANNYNLVSWTIGSGPPGSVSFARYNVYKLRNGLFGYIGSTDKPQFIDDNISADVARTPPIQGPKFDQVDEYPAAVTYYDQRKAIAGANKTPQQFQLSKTGTENNYSRAFNPVDSDAITYTVASRQQNRIKHLVQLGDLLMLTTGAEYRLSTVNSDVVTPTTISVRAFSYVGCSDAQPVVTDSACFFGARIGGRIREIRYQASQEGSTFFSNEDATLMAAHLFNGNTIKDMAFARGDAPILWAVNGTKLLGMTYVPEQQVAAWHQHDTKDGGFESVVVIPEGGVDVVYVVVLRKKFVNGTPVFRRYVERMLPRVASLTAAYFVDCGVAYTGAPISTVSGLHHLEGHTVSVLADGAVQAPKVVVNGQITLDQAASVIAVGLPITARLQTLPFASDAVAASGNGAHKNLASVYLHLLESSQVKVGASFERMTLLKQRTTEPYGSPPRLVSGVFEVVVEDNWGPDGAVCVEQTEPLPLTVKAYSAKFGMGD